MILLSPRLANMCLIYPMGRSSLPPGSSHPIAAYQVIVSSGVSNAVAVGVSGVGPEHCQINGRSARVARLRFTRTISSRYRKSLTTLAKIWPAKWMTIYGQGGSLTAESLRLIGRDVFCPSFVVVNPPPTALVTEESSGAIMLC